MTVIETKPSSPALDAPALRRWKGVKSFVEFFQALLSLPVAIPLIAAAGLLIKIEDGGPVFYRRRVVGPGGEFDAFKLRTMHIDADRILQQNPELAAAFQERYKLKNDPRVTGVGKYLRQWSLDELPQLFNVIRGQMSLVGPRMVTAPELEKFGPRRDIFRVAKPGLTGYWQVSGRQEVSYEERVQMEVHYIQNWSLWFDCRILVKTLWKVLAREGAY